MLAAISSIKVGRLTIEPTTESSASSYGIPVWPGMGPLKCGQHITLALIDQPAPLDESFRAKVVWADDCWAVLVLPDWGEGESFAAIQYVTGRMHNISTNDVADKLGGRLPTTRDIRSLADKRELPVYGTIPDWTGETIACTLIGV